MYKKWKTELFVRDIFLSHIQVWLIRASEPDIYSVILCQDPFQLRRGAENNGKKNFYHRRNTNSLRTQMWVRRCICTITLLMGKTMKIDNKRTSNNWGEPRTPQSSPLKNTRGVLKWRGGEEAARKTKKHLEHQFSV